MWIHYLGEIMIAVTVGLVVAHLGVHMHFKNKRRKRLAAEKKKQA